MSIIYCVEDDENIRELLLCSLSTFGHDVQVFELAKPMLNAAKNIPPHLIIMDIMLPEMDGLSALSILKADSLLKNLPVIMLTAKTTELDKIKGLDQGADDYITKPFSILELNSRIKAVLRRGNKTAKNTAVFKDLVLNTDKHTIEKNGIEISVTLKEYDLLKLLMHHKNQVVKRDEILNAVWGYNFVGETRTLDMHIKTLRKKLEDSSENPKYIKTVRGVGYTLLD